VLQAGGGAIAVIADSYSFEYIGIHISMAGLALQVFSLVIVLCLAADFASRCWRNKKKLDEKYEVIRSSRYFHGFIYGVYCSADVPWAPIRVRLQANRIVSALLTATVGILIRSTFRVAELTGGFHGKLWNNEIDFMSLDGAMVGLACLCLTGFHPGLVFHRK
jgi:hypothetical protein